MFSTEILAKNIKSFRKTCNMTQEQLAEMMNVSVQAVSKWECGKSIPELSSLYDLSKIFKVTIDEIVSNDFENRKHKAMIGIDGGGSKTEFVLFNGEGYILSRVVLEGVNANACGVEKTCELLKTGIDRLLAKESNISGIYAGLAGFASGENGTKIYNFLVKNYKKINIFCSTDIYNVLAGEKQNDNCLVMICGTGFVSYAKKKDKLHRIGGWGYLMDLFGSGYDIGREALRAALAQRDYIGEDTLITELVEKKIGGKVWDNIDKFYDGPKRIIASFSSIVFEAYRKGDKIAENILSANAERIAFIIDRAIQVYDCGRTVIIARGVPEQNCILIPMIEKFMKNTVNFIVPDYPPIYGACIKCMELCEMQNEDFEKNFKNDYSIIAKEDIES